MDLSVQVKKAFRRVENLIKSDLPSHELSSKLISELNSALHELQITGVKMLERDEEMAASRQTLEEERHRYQELFDFAPDSYLLTDTEGIILDANSAATNLFKISKCLFIGKPLAVFVCNEEHLTFRIRLAELKKGTAVQYENWESIMLSGKRTTFPVSITVGRVMASRGGSAELRWLLRDITKRKLVDGEREKLAVELTNAKLAAEASNIAKSQFLSDMSHDIRTPMTSIMGMTEITLSTELTEEQRHYLTIVKSSTKVLLRVLNGILDYSKIEEGKVILERVPFDIREIIHDVVDLFHITAKQKNINIRIKNIDNKIPENIIGDYIRLKHVLTNLVDNGVKFTNHGEVTISVNIAELGKSSIKLIFIVADSGIGIPEDKHNKLFKRFSQIDDLNTRKFGGTGLGLEISKKLVELMGGNIDLDSKEGVGSKFYFTAEFGVPEGETPSNRMGASNNDNWV